MSTLRLSIAKVDPAWAACDALPTGDLEPGGEGSPHWFGTSERSRWATLPERARPAFLVSRRLLRRLLEESTGVDRDAWRVSAQAGMPLVASLAADAWTASGNGGAGSQRRMQPPRASLSHRLTWVAAAVSDTAVGIDIECARSSRVAPCQRAALMLSIEELQGWNRLAPALQEPMLLTLWTLKEAWFKASEGQSTWDFRRIVARPSPPEHANARAWEAPPLHVAVSCADSAALAQSRCDGLDAAAVSTFWRLAPVEAA